MIAVEFVHTSKVSAWERPLASSINEIRESVQLSWYSNLLILYTNKTSGHVFFNLNLDLNLETSMWKHLLELE